MEPAAPSRSCHRPATRRSPIVLPAPWNKTGTFCLEMLYVDNRGIAGLVAVATV